ncbi:MAG: AsmA family protein, partial [Bacteroidales bacterium]|nr:AsmA family protein [Bacteroidales bacterium]
MSEINKKKTFKKAASIVAKTIKVISIALLSLVLLVGIVVGVALYIVFTPEKTTKIVNHYANEMLNADVNFSNIDITFLSTYPDFYLTINDGNIVSKAFKQEGKPFPEAKDSLLSFAACSIKLDPIKYLQTKDVEIDNIALEGINAFVLTDETGKANWEIFPPSEEDTTTTEFVLEDYLHSLAIENIEVTSGRIVYDDYKSNIFAKINKTKINLNGNFLDPNATLQLDLMLDKINFRTDSVVFAKDLNIDFSTQLAANLDSISVDLAKANLSINDIAFAMDGYVALPDSSRIDVDARLHASVPAIDIAKKMVPAALVPIINTMDATGSLDIDAEVKGRYSAEEYPTVVANMLLNDVTFKHESIDFWIRDIQFEANAFLD